MGKETIIYRDTREKVDKVKYSSRKEGDDSTRRPSFGRDRSALNKGKKNISKKVSDKNRRYKEYKMTTERKQ